MDRGDGERDVVTGVFTFDASFTLRDDIRWAAVWDGMSRGAVYQYPVGHAYPGRKGFWNSFWNRKYDHKLYLQADVPTEKGAQFGFQHSVAAFTTDGKQSWVEAAKAVVKWPTRAMPNIAASDPPSPASRDPTLPLPTRLP